METDRIDITAKLFALQDKAYAEWYLNKKDTLSDVFFLLLNQDSNPDRQNQNL